MIVHEMEQGGNAWLAARLGIPTASQFHRIITGAKGDLSKGSTKYAHALVAETLLGRPLETMAGTPWAMARGKELEPLAREHYAREHGVQLRQVGFVTTDCGQLGASPDSLVVGQSRGVEIKCTLDETHMGILLDGPGDDYRQQVQGSLAICELAEWDLWAWHPELPPARFTFTRDEPYIAKMQVALCAFLEERNAMLRRAEAAGWQARNPEPRPASFAALRSVA